DPHGLDFDDSRNELVVANHGNWTELRPYSPYDPLSREPQSYQPRPVGPTAARPGGFHPPSIKVFEASAGGDVKPLRSIAGPRTGLNWPMGLEVDAVRDEIVVANYGDSSVR